MRKRLCIIKFAISFQKACAMDSHSTSEVDVRELNATHPQAFVIGIK